MSDRSSNNGKKSDLDKIREKRANRNQGGIADWSDADPALLLEAVALMAYRGGAIRFGYSRDGGAFAIGIYLSDDKFTEYVRPSEDINAYLRSIVEDFAGPPAVVGPGR